MPGHWEELAEIYLTVGEGSAAKKTCFLSRQFTSDWKYLRMAEQGHQLASESNEPDVDSILDSAVPVKRKQAALYKKPLQKYSAEYQEDIAMMKAMGLPLSFTNRSAMDEEEEWVATACQPPPPLAKRPTPGRTVTPAEERGSSLMPSDPEPPVMSPNPEPPDTSPNPEPPVTSADPELLVTSPNPEPSETSPNPEPPFTSPDPEMSVTSPDPELSVTSPLSEVTYTSEQTERSSSPGGLEWLECDYTGGQGEPSLQWQPCDSAEFRRRWLERWSRCGEAVVLQTWMEKYRDHIDPDYLAQTEAASSAGELAPEPAPGADGSGGLSGQSEEQPAGRTSENEPPSGQDGEPDAPADAEPIQIVLTDPEPAPPAETPAAEGGGVAEGAELSWDELWQRHYQQVYDRLLADFRDEFERKEAKARTEKRKKEGVVGEKGDSAPRKGAGEKKKKEMASKKAKAMKLNSVGALLQQLKSSSAEPEPTESTAERVPVTASDVTACRSDVTACRSDVTSEEAAGWDVTGSPLKAEEIDQEPVGEEMPSESEESDGQDESLGAPGTVAYADRALTMMGFCHSAGDDVTKPSAAHVVFRQKKLRKKTEALNMIKTAFKQESIVKKAQRFLKAVEADVADVQSEETASPAARVPDPSGTAAPSGETSADVTIPDPSVTRSPPDETSADVTVAADDTSDVPAAAAADSAAIVAPPPDQSPPASGRRDGGKKKAKGRHKTKRPGTVQPMSEEMRSSDLLKKYWYQRYRLFSRYDEGVWLSGSSWFTVTPEQIAVHLAERCRADVIVDAFCGAGGNAIQFAFTCERVIAVDNDRSQLDLARHNAAVYGVADRIEFVLADFFQVAPRLRADAVFLSPPWGGPQYCDAEVYDIYRLDGTMNGRRMMAAARDISPNIALLAPRNADVHQLTELAGPGGRVEIEQNLLNGKIKTLTAYYGDLIACGEPAS